MQKQGYFGHGYNNRPHSTSKSPAKGKTGKKSSAKAKTKVNKPRNSPPPRKSAPAPAAVQHVGAVKEKKFAGGKKAPQKMNAPHQQNKFSNRPATETSISLSRGGSPGMEDDEFADPMDDYDSEISYDNEFDDSMKPKGIDFKNDYEPIKLGLKQDKMEIVLEYQKASSQNKRF